VKAILIVSALQGITVVKQLAAGEQIVLNNLLLIKMKGETTWVHN